MQIAATIPASDIERSKAWYAEVFGFVPVETTASGDVWYDLDGSRLMLYESSLAGTNKATAATMRVDDVEATVVELQARGAVFEEYDFGEAFRTVDGIATSADGFPDGLAEGSGREHLSIGSR